MFEPLSKRGNSGPGSVAEIHLGTYQTRPDKGIVGGPHRVRIMGTDGTVATEVRDNALFTPYQTEVDLPRSDGQWNFEVPVAREK